MAKKEELNPDGSPIPVIDSATMWAAAMLESMPDIPELTDEQFAELVDVIRAADKRVAARQAREKIEQLRRNT